MSFRVEERTFEPVAVKKCGEIGGDGRSIEIASKTYENLVYLGDLFDKSASQIWIDEWHVTPEGNRLVAERMLDVIASRYGRASS